MWRQGSLPSVTVMQIPLLSQWVDHWVDHWAVGAQQRSRRNAMIASTALAHQRAERIEVQDFLDSLQTRSDVVQIAVAR